MREEGRRRAAFGAVLVALGIAAGAFGAHALKAQLTPEQLSTWQTAVSYQMWSGVGLLALAALPGNLRLPVLLIAVGAVLFSGSLYVLALGGAALFGPITPVGGVLMIAGWGLAAVRLALR